VIPVLIVIGVIVLLLLFVVSLYNRFVQLRNRIDNAWAQVDVVLRRRYDLIPNLVETVKGYASHERETFEAVTNARAAASAAKTVQEQGQAENMLTGALRQLFAVAEAYPELRANENFQQLQGEITNTEGQIATARQIYNDTVLNYNNAIQVFPGVLLAGPFGFTSREFLEMEEAARAVPKVDFRDMPGREGGPSDPPAPTA
jgi:LemA protein